jgi:hypothetical protein
VWQNAVVNVTAFGTFNCPRALNGKKKYTFISLLTTAPSILESEDKITSASYQYFKISSLQVRMTQGLYSPKCDVTLTRNLRYRRTFLKRTTERKNGIYNTPN